MHGRIKSTAVLGTALLAFGCADAEKQAGPLAPDAAMSIATEQSSEKVALSELTRMVALALNDQGLRQRVKNDLRESRHTVEHKLQFSNYLHGNSGGILLAKMAKESGKSREEIQALLTQVRPLEFYMPVDEHRESWTGGSDLLIASLLRDKDVPLVLTLSGESVAIAAGAAPLIPTLVLTSRETDFSQPLEMAKYKNARDQGGEAIGTLLIEPPCIECDPGPSSPPAVTYPPGVYLDYSTLTDTGEADLRGDPEIELFVIGPTYHASSQGERISCSGQGGAAGGKYYDQNNNTWRAPYWTVQGQILSKDEVGRYFSIYNAPYGVQLWEDDQDPCQIIYSGRSELQQLYDNLMSAKRATTILMRIVDPYLNPTLDGNLKLDGGIGYALRSAVAGIFQSDDDFLGNVVYTPGTERTTSDGKYVDADVVKHRVNFFTGSKGELYSNGKVRIRTID